MLNSFLLNTALFRGTTEAEIDEMLNCLGAFTRQYEKHSLIYHVGENIQCAGLVISGSVNIEVDDIWGNKSVFGHVASGQIFAETYACIPGEQLMINVVSCEKTEVMFLNMSRLIATCPNSCAHHNRLIQNLLQISAQKNLSLSRRILHSSSKSIRGRLQSYFSEQVKLSGSYSFTIPFNRQQLADYLGVDRSALSNELSKMQKDGLLTYEHNLINLKQR